MLLILFSQKNQALLLNSTVGDEEMELELSRLHQIFDPFPEPVFLLSDLHILYTNSAGEALLLPFGQEFPPTLLAALPEHDGEAQCALDAGSFHITATTLPTGRLVVLRPVPDPPVRLPGYANVPTRLRDHLASLSAASEQLIRKLGQEHHLDSYRDLLSIQNQAIHRILRLARQMELSLDDWEQAYPLGAVDLAAVCKTLSTELADRVGSAGSQFLLQTKLSCLLLTGNKGLLEQLVLSLVSNGIKSAGKDGKVELTLSQQRKQAVISVWDSGAGIPEDRLLHLFSQQGPAVLPRPNEGAGLDLWLAHRIAVFHHGVIVAVNRPGGGAEFTVSIPIRPPQQLRLQSDDESLIGEGFSPVLIGLADALPRAAFHPSAEP